MSRKYVSLDKALRDLELDEDPGLGGWAGDAGHARPRGAPRTDRKHGGGGASYKLSSAEYINITCRLVVHPDTPASVAAFPDKPLPRRAILRFVAPVTECPICLERAQVPRMLACGHTMCLVCFHRFMRHSEDRLCPLCAKHVPLETTPVSFLHDDDRFLPQVGHEAVLTLNKRPSMGLPQPVALPDGNGTRKLPGPDMILYSRIAAATEEYLRQEARAERNLLISAQKEAALESEDEGYEAALAEVNAMVSASIAPLPPIDWPEEETKTPQQTYYYYQTGFDASTAYVLQPLDISILKSAFGSYDEFPASLIVKVENVVHASLEDETRRRTKYLSHLPTHSPVVFLECNWNNVVPTPVLKKFRKQLSERRQKKRERDRRDEAKRKEAIAENDIKMKTELFEPLPTALPISLEALELPSLGETPVRAQPAPNWDASKADREEFEEMYRNAYISKRGRKKIVLSTNN